MSSDGPLSEVGIERVRDIGRERARERGAAFSKLRHYAALVSGLFALGGTLSLVLTTLAAAGTALGLMDGPSVASYWRHVLLNVLWIAVFGPLSIRLNPLEVGSRV